MKISTARYVRQFLERIHPPLPATQRESRELLTVLQRSFRKRLDEIHPSPQVFRETRERDARQIPLSPLEASSAVAHRHMNSILHHPLLAPPPSHPQPVDEAISEILNDFDQLAATETFDAVGWGDLIDRYMLVRSTSGLSDARLGPRIASWFQSASAQLKQDFLLSPALLYPVVRVMAVDQEETTVWTWLRVLYERDLGQTVGVARSLTDPDWLRAEDYLVAALMQLSIWRRDLVDAAQHYSQAYRYRALSGRPGAATSSEGHEFHAATMSRSWKCLAAAILHARTRHGIPELLFDQISSTGLSWHDHPHLNPTFLRLYHPRQPSAGPLCNKLSNAESAAQFRELYSASRTPAKRAILGNVLGGAQLALDQGIHRDAAFLVHFARQNFPELQGLASPTNFPRTESQSCIQTALDVLQEYAWSSSRADTSSSTWPKAGLDSAR